jgi:hypothetical protein
VVRPSASWSASAPSCASRGSTSRSFVWATSTCCPTTPPPRHSTRW